MCVLALPTRVERLGDGTLHIPTSPCIPDSATPERKPQLQSCPVLTREYIGGGEVTARVRLSTDHDDGLKRLIVRRCQSRSLRLNLRWASVPFAWAHALGCHYHQYPPNARPAAPTATGGARSHALAHTRSLTRARSHALAHTRARSHALAHTRSLTRARSHALAHTRALRECGPARHWFATLTPPGIRTGG